MKSNIVFSSQSDEWETPQDLFDKLNTEFKFDLDPCATHENRKCLDWYSKELNGLKQAWWWKRVFCNPPYSQISKWVEKSASQFALIVMLVPARTDTKWFHNYIYKNPNCEIRFIKGRLKFSNSKNSAPFPSMIVIFRNGVK